MSFLSLLQATESVPWPTLALYGPTLLLVALAFLFVYKMAPTWKEVKFKELGLRETELKIRESIVAALARNGEGLSQMAQSLSSMSETTREIAVEQRRATEAVKLIQRVNADTSDHIDRSIAILNDRVDRIEQVR